MSSDRLDVALIAHHATVFSGRLQRYRAALRAAGRREALFMPAGIAQSAPAPPETIFTPGRAVRSEQVFDRWLTARARKNGLVGAVLERGPGTIAALDPDSLPAARAAADRLKARLVYDIQEAHDGVTHATPARKAWVLRIERRSARRLDGWTCISASLAEHYMSTRRFSADGLVIAPNSLPAARIAPAYDGRLHAAAGVPRERRIALFHGYFAEARGLERLCDAALRLPEHWSVVCMGWGPLEAMLRRAGRVTVLPPVSQEDLLGWIAGARVGAVLYRDGSLNHRLSTPNKFYECAAARVPMVCSSLPGLSALIEQSGAGVTVDSEASAEAIADAIVALGDGANYDDFAARAEAFVRAHAWDAVEPALQTLYTPDHTLKAART